MGTLSHPLTLFCETVVLLVLSRVSSGMTLSGFTPPVLSMRPRYQARDQCMHQCMHQFIRSKRCVFSACIGELVGARCSLAHPECRMATNHWAALRGRHGLTLARLPVGKK